MPCNLSVYHFLPFSDCIYVTSYIIALSYSKTSCFCCCDLHLHEE